VKKSFLNKPKKIGVLLALLISNSIEKLVAEEVIGTILSEPWMDSFGRGLQANYAIGIRNVFVADKVLESFIRDKSGKPNTYSILSGLLKNGSQIVFEDEGLQSDFFERDRLIRIIWPDGTIVDLTQVFTMIEIKREFPYLYNKDIKVSNEANIVCLKQHFHFLQYIPIYRMIEGIFFTLTIIANNS
jgi:hypothetical protein